MTTPDTGHTLDESQLPVLGAPASIMGSELLQGHLLELRLFALPRSDALSPPPRRPCGGGRIIPDDLGIPLLEHLACLGRDYAGFRAGSRASTVPSAVQSA